MTQETQERRVVDEKVLSNLSALLRSAKDELAEAWKAYQDRSHEIVMKRFSEEREATRAIERDFAREMARFRIRHAAEIVAVGASDPHGVAHIVDLYQEDWYDEARFGDYLQTMRVLEGLGLRVREREEVAPPNPPIIVSCPNPLRVGEEHVILGSGFGTAEGTLELEVSGYPTVIHTTVSAWSDDSVLFSIPESVDHVPAHAEGTLTLKRVDPTPGTGPWTEQHQTHISITVEPLERLYHMRDSLSDVGKDVLTFSSHERTVTLRSPPLPDAYRLHTADYMAAPGIILYIHDHTWVILEEGAKYELISGPAEVQDHLEATVKITDDWYWDYTLTWDWYIIVPKGYALASAWRD